MPTTDQPMPPGIVALPGVFTRVRLPTPPNFLHLAAAEATIPLGDLTSSDAVLLALAMARGVLSHWREKRIALERLSPAEAERLDTPELVHPAIVDKLARQWCSARGQTWGGLPASAQADCRTHAAALIRYFLEEITRAP